MTPKNDPEIDARIAFPESGVELNCLIRHVNDDIYRICEHPTFAEDQVLFGDLARMLKNSNEVYEFQEVVSRSKLKLVQYTINVEIALEIEEILDETMRSNGYWQRDFGGFLSLYYDARVFDPRSDLETIFKLQANGKT